MEVVTERLLHEERKLKERLSSERGREGAMPGNQRPKGKGPKYHHCGKFGQIKRNCHEEARSNKLKVNKAEVRRRDSSSSDDDCVGLMVNHLLSGNSPGPSMNGSWIQEQPATCVVTISCLMSFTGCSSHWKCRWVMDKQWKQQGVALLYWS